MNRCIRLLPFFIGVLVLGACSQIKGYRIDGSAPLPEFEGKMVYMKDVSTDAPVDSARIINGKFAFADTTKIENPVIKILSIHASKIGLEYREYCRCRLYGRNDAERTDAGFSSGYRCIFCCLYG